METEPETTEIFDNQMYSIYIEYLSVLQKKEINTFLRIGMMATSSLVSAARCSLLLVLVELLEC